MWGLALLHAFVREKLLILQHATAHASMSAEARRQAVRAIQVRATRHVLHTEARGRAQVASTPHALHNMLLRFTTQRRALILAEALRRRMYGRRLPQLLSRRGPPPLTATEQAQLPECAVPIAGPQRVFQLLRPHKRTRSVYDTEEREAAHAHRPGLTPSDGRERGKRPRRSTEF